MFKMNKLTAKNQHKYKRREVDTSYRPSELHPKTKNNKLEDKHGKAWGCAPLQIP
ncbi:hypothetical protein Hdeb2414_s0016g00495381 [Helianthus debilis subsp. tardiflorus]